MTIDTQSQQGPSFRHYLCWDPVGVPDIVKVDATSPHAAELLAVHHKAKIHVGSASGPVASEEQILESLLDPSQKLRILPILGDAGTGKSHLVQWLRAQIENRARLQVVYVPRSRTGLRGVLEILVGQLERNGDSDSVRGLRESLREAFSDGASRDRAGELIDAMARTLEQMAQEDVDEGLDRRMARRQRGITGELPALFRDPIGRSFFLRDDGPISQFLADQSGAGVESDGEGFVFSAEDFPEADRLPRFAELGRPAAEVLRDVLSSREFREIAARVTSEAMNRAIPAIFGLSGQVTLKGVFQETRRTLLKRGDELVILIEDLSKLQGVDRELLDAILDNPEEDGVQVLCNLRVAIAVTTGYYKRVENTVESRAEFAVSKYVLDVPYGDVEGAYTNEDVAQFVSRYLNAVRVGSDTLRAAYSATAEHTDEAWIPNACTECVFREECRTSFGSVGETNLYPLNREALAAMAQSVLKQQGFNPRRILGRIVHSTLIKHAEDLARGRFPSQEFIADFPDAPPLTGTALASVGRHPDAQRREVLLRFWGGAPSELINLAPGIHEAFGIAELDGAGSRGLVEATVVGNTPTPQPPPPPPPPPPTATAVELWANGAALERADTAEIQRLLFGAVTARVRWSTLGVQPSHPFFVGPQRAGMSRVLRDTSFHIEDSLGRDRDSTQVVVPITRAAHRELLLHLDRAKVVGSLIALGAEAYAHVQAELDSIAALVEASIREAVGGTDDSALRSMVERLALEAAANGRVDDPRDRVALAIACLESRKAVRAAEPTPWAALSNTLQDHQTELRRNVILLAEGRQGDAQRPSIVRIGRIAHLLRPLTSAWEIRRTTPPLPDALHNDLEALSSRDLNTRTNQELGRLRASYFKVNALLGEPPWKMSEAANELRLALEAAESSGCFPGDPTHYRTLIDQMAALHTEPLIEVASTLPGEAAPLGDRLVACGRMQALHFDEVLVLLERLDNQFQLALQTATERLRDEVSGQADSALGTVTSEVSRLLEILEALT